MTILKPHGVWKYSIKVPRHGISSVRKIRYLRVFDLRTCTNLTSARNRASAVDYTVMR
jgi:hypothetical protein